VLDPLPRAVEATDAGPPHPVPWVGRRGDGGPTNVRRPVVGHGRNSARLARHHRQNRAAFPHEAGAPATACRSSRRPPAYQAGPARRAGKAGATSRGPGGRRTA